MDVFKSLLYSPLWLLFAAVLVAWFLAVFLIRETVSAGRGLIMSVQSLRNHLSM